MFEEPARTLRVMAEDVLGGTTTLADTDWASTSRARSSTAF
jgi:hypothetical protein